eukprot:GHVR01105535.1.p1 GENE.GHVR01105535.1~~GHVR01105535.1.p1  ORF type:complete len:196 (+),score=10.10 GHVR01105535.1:49-636(+)
MNFKCPVCFLIFLTTYIGIMEYLYHREHQCRGTLHLPEYNLEHLYALTSNVNLSAHAYIMQLRYPLLGRYVEAGAWVCRCGQKYSYINDNGCSTKKSEAWKHMQKYRDVQAEEKQKMVKKMHTGTRSNEISMIRIDLGYPRNRELQSDPQNQYEYIHQGLLPSTSKDTLHHIFLQKEDHTENVNKFKKVRCLYIF